MRSLVAGVIALAACKTETAYTVVTVDAKPSVHGASTLKVTLADGSTSQTNELPLAGAAFPTTFSVSAPGHMGDYQIQIDAVDDGDVLVGSGATTATFGAAEASVTLAGADFVVNTDFAMDQSLDAFNIFGVGFELAATSDDHFAVTFRDQCSSPCNMFARRFDATGLPLSSTLAAGINAFPVSTDLTDSGSTPAIAAAGTSTVALWDFGDSAGTTGVACRAIDASGASAGDQVTISTDPTTDTASATALSNGNFAVTWTGFLTSVFVIRAAIIKPDCSIVSNPVTVSPAATEAFFDSTVSANGPNVIYGYRIDESLHVRIANSVNSFTTADGAIVTAAAADDMITARFAPLGTGWLMGIRYESATSETSPGRIEVTKVSSTGALMGAPIVVTMNAGSDFNSAHGFGMAARSDGVILIVWHACGANGDGNDCGVFGQVVSPAGDLVGTPFVIPSTTMGPQTDPSVAALSDAFVVSWTDGSAQAPDTSGLAVRARIVYVGPDGSID
jgi:hypothetical protein